jgi:hypothetical protein
MPFWRDTMARDIDTYLRELQAALTGADPALIQDALFDAEEHLRAELAAVEANRGTSAEEADARFASVVDEYGTPEEVAAAYLAAPSDARAPTAGATIAARSASGAAAAAVAGGAAEPVASSVVSRPDAADLASAGATGEYASGPGPTAEWTAARPQRGAWARFFGVVVDSRVYKTLLYMILSLATGIAYFTIVVTGFSLSAGLIVLIVGLPILLLFLGVVRGLALFEGRLVELLLGTRMPRRPRAEPQGAGFVQRMWFWLKDGRTWVAMVYMVLQLPLGIIYFTLAVTGLSVGAYGIVLPFMQLGLGHTYVTYGASNSEFFFRTWEMPFSVIAGALFFVIWLHVIRGIGRGHAAYAKGMLVRLVK